MAALGLALTLFCHSVVILYLLCINIIKSMELNPSLTTVNVLHLTSAIQLSPVPRGKKSPISHTLR